MNKGLSIIFLTFLLLLTACNNDEQKIRVEKLGEDIYKFALQGDYEANLPEELVFIGNTTFWKLLEINLPIDSLDITVQDSGFSDDRADFLIDFGTSVGLKIRYDSEIDKFHIIGFQGTITSINENESKRLGGLDQDLYKVGDIIPSKGLEGITVKKSIKDDVFRNYSESDFNRLGLYFDFQKDTLDRIYISKYQLKTKEGIRPKTSSKREIIEAYGEPESIGNEIFFLNKKIKNIEQLNYKGISFILLKDELMIIVIK